MKDVLYFLINLAFLATLGFFTVNAISRLALTEQQAIATAEVFGWTVESYDGMAYTECGFDHFFGRKVSGLDSVGNPVSGVVCAKPFQETSVNRL